MTPTPRRGTRRPVLADNPDVVRDIGRVADDLDNAPAFDFGTAAVRAGIVAPYEGYIFWTTDDLTIGASGSPYVWRAGAWRLWAPPADGAAGVASARTLGVGALQATAGNDARLSDARAPTAHAATHRNTGSDPLNRLALSARGVLDIGQLNQIRAGRVLTLADFTVLLGRSTPIGLYNLADLTDISGNARTLTNKGAVTFGGTGIAGQANVAIFNGSVNSVLYINDVAVWRIKTGSVGCWFKTAKRGTDQMLVTKYSNVAGQRAYCLFVNASNQVELAISTTGSDEFRVAVGSSDVCDDRWHFAVGTFDGSVVRTYVDGALEASGLLSATIFQGTEPLNIGGRDGDAATNANAPFFGRIDEAFVTADVIDPDDVRLLYAAKVSHGYATTPQITALNVRRRKRGGALSGGDFPSNPLSLFGFQIGALTDAGTLTTALTNNGGALSVAGADGIAGNSFIFSGAQSLSKTDAGLPSALTVRSYGCWAKTTSVATGIIMGWGTLNTGDARLILGANGLIQFTSSADGGGTFGPFIADGQWHHLVVVEDNAAVDGVKRKLYLDGKLVLASTVMNPIVLAGPGNFRVGSNQDGSSPLTGQVDEAFVIGAALTNEQVAVLYQKSTIALGLSPKNSGDHIEAIDATNLYLICDALETQNTIDLEVAS